MCQFNGQQARCRNTRRHFAGTRCPSTGQLATGIPELLGAVGVGLAAVLVLPRILDGAVEDAAAEPDTQPARVVRIIDGDTLDVGVEGSRHRVRIVGIDTPEKGDCYAQKATDWIRKRLPEGTRVELVDDPTQPDTDRYDRLLRYVYVDDLDVGKRLLETGHARPFDTGPASEHPRLSDYQDAADQARRQERGQWSKC